MPHKKTNLPKLQGGCGRGKKKKGKSIYVINIIERKRENERDGKGLNKAKRSSMD